jgi:type 1 glutamine amidotransferase
MKKVLLVTAGIFHPTYFGRMALHRSLHQLDGFSFDRVASLKQLPSNLLPYSALVLHYHHKAVSERALHALKEYVANGGGILAIHAATASFKASLPYFEILGGRFIGHGQVEKIEVTKIRDEIFHGIGDFTVRDELYIHELHPGIEVHFTAKHEGRDVPIVWTYRYGKGKVCYAGPGHTTSTMKNQTYQQLLQRGLNWVTG